MRTYKVPDFIFSMLITSIIDKLVGNVFKNDTVYIPNKLQESVLFACHVLLSEHFNASNDEGLPLLRRALSCMRSTLHNETHKLYLDNIRAGERREVHAGAHPPASRYDVNPYVLGSTLAVPCE